jgi:hypothetical protein
MTPTRRMTVYFEATLHRAIELKAADTKSSISELVNAAVRLALAEDADDLAAFRARANEPRLAFTEVVRNLNRRAGRTR